MEEKKKRGKKKKRRRKSGEKGKKKMKYTMFACLLVLFIGFFRLRANNVGCILHHTHIDRKRNSSHLCFFRGVGALKPPQQPPFIQRHGRRRWRADRRLSCVVQGARIVPTRGGRGAVVICCTQALPTLRAARHSVHSFRCCAVSLLLLLPSRAGRCSRATMMGRVCPLNCPSHGGLPSCSSSSSSSGAASMYCKLFCFSSSVDHIGCCCCCCGGG